MARSNRTKLKTKLDDIVKEKVKQRDGFICQHCGKFVSGSNCHTSHVIPKSHGDILRWDLLNLKVLCYHCHLNWWHKNPVEAGDWFKKKFPDRWKYLEKRKDETAHYKDFQLEDILKELKNT